MPYVNPKIQPKHDHDLTLGHTTTTTTTTTTQHLTTLPDIETIDRSINHSYTFSSRNRADATDAVAPPAAAATPTHTYSNRNMQSNINSIFIPASTSKYPIKQSTITEDFRERFSNFVEHWTKAIVYLSRKWNRNCFNEWIHGIYSEAHNCTQNGYIERGGDRERDIQAYLILIVEIRSENTPAKSRQANCSNQWVKENKARQSLAFTVSKWMHCQ